MTDRRWWTSDLHAALVVVGAAALARGLHLALSAGSPFFAEPVVDALTYHELARDLAAGGPLTDQLLWQAPFAPLALAGLYAVVGPSVAAARVMGALVGVATTLAAWRLGRRALGPGGGLATGLVVALHGVLVVFDTELLATGWATLWFVLGAWLLAGLRGANGEASAGGGEAVNAPATVPDHPTLARAAALGLVLALALLTRTVVAPALAAGLAWWAWRSARPPGARLAAAAVAATVVLAPFAAVMHHHTGHAGLWPPSGAVNVYLGNNPDLDATLTIRPGLPWEALIAAPVRETGVNDPWRSAAWYGARTRRFAAREPGAALANLGRKAVHLLTSRELPRNVDVYALRPWSPVLQGLLWRAGPFGFPTGVVLPLALVGVALARRRLPPELLLTMAVYALALILVFTSSRYRAPLWPLAAVAAVAGAQALDRAMRARAWRRVAAGAAVGVAAVTLGTVPGPFAQERLDLRAEMWHGVGFNQLRRGDLEEAEASFRQALARRDDYPEAWNRLGVTLARQERYLASIPCFERAAALAPGYPDPGPNLELARERAARKLFLDGHTHQQAGRDRAAAAVFERVLELAPHWAEPRGRLAWILATTANDSLRDPERAVALARRALADHGADHPWLREVLETAKAAAGR